MSHERRVTHVVTRKHQNRRSAMPDTRTTDSLTIVAPGFEPGVRELGHTQAASDDSLGRLGATPRVIRIGGAGRANRQRRRRLLAGESSPCRQMSPLVLG
jgi:hypothetical protein